MKPLRPAERILLDLGIREPGEIDLEAIAWTLGAAVKYRPLEKCEAMIVGSARRAIISVNSHSRTTRRRFSLGHELGHWHHHRGRILFCGPGDVGNPAHGPLNPESQADRFASDLLMPEFMFRPRVTKMKRLALATVSEIAEEFGVSLTAALLRLIDCDCFPLMAVCHDKQRRRWFRRAPMIANRWFPKEELDHESIAFDLLFGGAAESSYPRRVEGDTWFDFHGADRFDLKEQAFLLPNEEVLTLLILPDEAAE